MRGVYILPFVTEGMRRGSSPLARGLRRTGVRKVLGSRIIPACAGFTIVCSSRRRPGTDHPRLRGVYGSAHRLRRRAHGSSPLARGLRDAVRNITQLNGIIPACAGFTQRVRGHLERCWIIPACAGFTRCVRRRGILAGDHPRLRGVYRGVIRVMLTCRGIIPACAGFTPA